MTAVQPFALAPAFPDVDCDAWTGVFIALTPIFDVSTSDVRAYHVLAYICGKSSAHPFRRLREEGTNDLLALVARAWAVR